MAELAHDYPGFICADLDLSGVDKMRQRIPAWNRNERYSQDLAKSQAILK